eukprot:CAMPEP_0178888104 /NCGR_PEP_ID=MMETSP0747-20121128/16989_1 /TAXON_ID=913974 /ORGANISM="Nitzschia punctata, Strain CCMP561" /LENGTH=166 /DNA_ID=CAMNT_0020557383 /DNA_START=259 /DNA_END=757 /DNA_ORIENTATION=+
MPSKSLLFGSAPVFEVVGTGDGVETAAEVDVVSGVAAAGISSTAGAGAGAGDTVSRGNEAVVWSGPITLAQVSTADIKAARRVTSTLSNRSFNDRYRIVNSTFRIAWDRWRWLAARISLQVSTAETKAARKVTRTLDCSSGGLFLYIVMAPSIHAIVLSMFPEELV